MSGAGKKRRSVFWFDMQGGRLGSFIYSLLSFAAGLWSLFDFCWPFAGGFRLFAGGLWLFVGGLRLFGGGLWSFAGGLWSFVLVCGPVSSFVVVTCFSYYTNCSTYYR